MALVRNRVDFVEILTIDRPESANSIDLNIAHSLSSALDDLEHDVKVRAVVITGSGDRFFCAGMDLKAVTNGQADEINGIKGGFAGLVRRTEFPHPIIAAVNGAAVGGGFEIVLACDLVVAADNASFALPEARRGLMAASGGLVRLAKRIPPTFAFELALTGRAIDAQRAFQLGLVNRVVSRGHALEEAIALAQEIAANAPLAVRASKRLLRFSLETGDESAVWSMNYHLAGDVLASADAKEGARAFAEKRQPQWSI